MAGSPQEDWFSVTRVYYRLSLSAVCALAAFAGPIIFLEDRARVGYLLGGLAAAFITWLSLWATIATEPHMQPGLQLIVGAGAAVFSWATISLVAVFDIIPHVFQFGLTRFDPVWILGGLSPVVILGVAWWRASRDRTVVWQALSSALLRFSLPLLALTLVSSMLSLPKQYRWLFLFDGVMFLVLDALGTGDDLPLSLHQKDGARA